MLQNGERFTYDYLIVAAGCQIDWKGIPGLYEALNLPGMNMKTGR
jgi:NADH dehydrogenase FAD-containing subunit